MSASCSLTQDCPAAVENQYSDHDIAKSDDLLGRENAAVLTHDRNLGQHQRKVVSWNSSPQALPTCY